MKIHLRFTHAQSSGLECLHIGVPVAQLESMLSHTIAFPAMVCANSDAEGS